MGLMELLMIKTMAREMYIQNLILIVFIPILLLPIINPPLGYLSLLVLLAAQERRFCLPSSKPLSYWQQMWAAPSVMMLVFTSKKIWRNFSRWGFDFSSLCACKLKLKFNRCGIFGKIFYYQTGKFYFCSLYGWIQVARKIFFNLIFHPKLLALRRKFRHHSDICKWRRCQLHALMYWLDHHCWLLQKSINVDHYLLIHKHIMNCR